MSKATLPANVKPHKGNIPITDEDLHDNETASEKNTLEQYIHTIKHNSKETYKSILAENLDKEFLEGSGKSMFLIHKHLHDSGQFKKEENNYPDDETENANSPKLHNRLRMRMMIKISRKK